MTSNSRLSRLSTNLILTVGMAALLIVIFANYMRSETEIDSAYDSRLQSHLMADELRQSSEDLTKMAHLYVMTGNPRYKEYFQDIQDIRDGKKPRPEHYHNVYWDLFLASGSPPRGDSGQAVPLMELMRQAGFNQDEMKKLAEAQANTETLAATELAAMKLAEAEGRDAEASRSRARMMLSGYNYLQARAAIMKSISEFDESLDRRTVEAVRAAEKHSSIWRGAFIAFSVWLMYMLWRSYKILKLTLAGRINDAAIASSVTAIAMSGLDGKISYVNRAFVEMLKMQREEDAVGLFGDQIWANPEEARAVIDAVKQQGCWQGEMRALLRDGSLADLQLSANLVRDDLGRPLSIMATFMDITASNLAEQQLQRSNALLESLVESMPVMVFVKRADDLSFEKFNRAGELLLGISEKDMLGKNDRDLFPSEQADFFIASDREVLDSHQLKDIPHETILSRSGETKILHTRKIGIYDAAGEPTHLLGIAMDITERVQAEESLRVAAVAFETHEAIMITDANANIIRVNRAFQELTGYSAQEVMGRNPRLLSSGRQSKEFYIGMWQQLLKEKTWSGELWDQSKDGREYPKWLTITAVVNDLGEIAGFVGIFSDMTARKKAEEDIHNLAFYDALSKLPNRRLLLDHFHSAISQSVRSNLYGAVLFLDLDKFKTINDTLGHDSGDLLLIEVALRIRACVREVDTVARLGGDEFVILIGEIGGDVQEASNHVALIAEKIRSSLSKPYQLGDNEYHSSSSIGVCLYRGNAEKVEDLLKHADLAMYQAKDSGRDAVRFFDPLMQESVERHAELESDLRRAVPGGQLLLHYQIQVDNDNRPIGAEALVRWIHPTRGIVMPAEFITVAEESSLILEIGDWVLGTACKQLAAWSRNELTRDLVLAVNVSGQQFRVHDFVDRVAKAVRAHRIDPMRLKLELTESVVLSDVADVVTKMHALKGTGVQLSMDDFGTGYSSLSYLKRLPLDQLKIDQSFVRDITSDLNDAVMVQTIIDLGTNFRLNVIAEGVETEAQLAFLKQHGCMAYQGFLFGKPVSIEQFEALLLG